MAEAKPDEETRKFATLKDERELKIHKDPKKRMLMNLSPELQITKPRYLCEVHGVVEFAIISQIKGKEGMWCQLCQLEWFDKNITKVAPINEKPK